MNDKVMIPVVMVCDEKFVMQTCVALTSMYMNKADSTEYDVYVIMANGNSASYAMLEKLRKVDFQISIIETTLDKYQEINQLAHVSVAGLLKFEICDLVPQYDKLLYLDGDIIVRQDLQSLYQVDLGDNYAAAAVHSIGVITGEKKLNSGVLLLNARRIRQEGMRDIFWNTRQSLGNRRSMDQETFFLVFGENRVILHPKYNVMLDKIDYEKKYYALRDYNAYYGTQYKTRKEIIDTAVIIHFTGAIKPWLYDFSICGKEWLKYYECAVGSTAPLKLKSKRAYLGEQLKKDGWKGLYWLFKDRILRYLGEYFNLFIDKSHGIWN